MPYCPKCRAEYREGFEVCGSCNVQLVDSMEEIPEPLSDEHVAEMLRDRPVLPVVRGGVEACKEIRDALLMEQIPAVIRTPEDMESFAAVAMVLEVAVLEEDLPRSVAALQADWHDMLSRDGLQFAVGGISEEVGEDEELACPGCGSTKPLENGECPDCGLNLGGE